MIRPPMIEADTHPEKPTMPHRLASITALLFLALAGGVHAQAGRDNAGYIRVEEREESGGVALQIALKRMPCSP